jgi:short-subunit dehydrogenase
MSSLAGLIGMQLVAPYAATKAFTWNLAEALHYELKQYNIDIMACIAGATATPAYLETLPQYGLIKPAVMKPDKVAEEALINLGRKTLFIPGLSNRISYFLLTRVLPRKVASAITNGTMRKLYSHKTEQS